MKRILPYLFMFFYCCFVQAQTNVRGTLTSNTEWTLEGSPYILTSTVGVLKGNTLTIKEGVEVQGDFDLLVKGSVLIQGKLANNIVFKNTRLIFESTNLTASKVEYVEFTETSGVQLADEAEHNEDTVKNSGILTVLNSKFINNSYARTKGYNTTAKLKIVNSNFEDSTIKGFYPRSEYIEVINCNINNSTINSDSYNLGVTLTNSSIKNSEFSIGCCGANINIDSCKVNNSIFKEYNNYYEVNINNSLLTNTEFRLQSGELNVSNSLLEAPKEIDSYHIEARNIKLSNVILLGNENSLGVKVIDKDFTSIIEGCTFSNYKKAVELNVKASYYPDAFTIHKKYKPKQKKKKKTFNFTFKNNNFLGITEEIFTNKFNNDIDATQNYWGVIDESVISNKIFDGLDDINYGVVNYSNFLTIPTNDVPISEPKNVFKGTQNNGVLITWQANEESNLGGYKIYKKDNITDDYVLIEDVGNVTSFFTDQISVGSMIAIKSYSIDADSNNDFIEGNESNFSNEAKEIISNVTLSSSEICKGTPLVLSFNSDYNFSNNEFILELSEESQIFNSAIELGRISSSNNDFLVNLPDNIQLGVNYLVRIKSSELDVVSSSFNIISYDTVTSDFEINNSKTCSEEVVVVTYTGNATSSAIYNWNFEEANIVSGSGAGPYEIDWNDNGNKKISLEVIENNCSSITEKEIEVLNKPLADFIVSSTICEGEKLTITYNGNATSSAIYNWDFEGATIVSGEGVGPYEITWNESYGEKNITLSVSENGCTSDLAEKKVTHYPYPEASITVNDQVCSGDITTVVYSGTVSSNAIFNWNFNGATIISGSNEGPYELIWYGKGEKSISLEVLENGCSSFEEKTINVNQTPATSFYVNDTSVCSEETVWVYYNGDVIDGATYNWDFDGGTIISGEDEGPYEITWEENFGEKNISLSVSNNSCTSEIRTEVVQYNQSPTLSFEAEDSVCLNQDFSIEYTGENFTDVDWYFGDATIISGSGTGPYILQWDRSGDKKIYFQANNNGCYTYGEVDVTVLPALTKPEICSVTVDEESLKNKIVWSYDSDRVSQFGVYKETNIAGEYELLSYVNSSINEFIDKDSSPLQRSNLYKLTAVDICGGETELSDYHKTIHLVIGEGPGNSWNLIWDNYDGFNFLTYRILRSLDGSDFELLTEISSSLNSYTDLNVTTENVAYMIEVVSSKVCGVTSNKFISSSNRNDFSSSRSNIVSSNGANKNLEEMLKAYPNPVSDYVNIDLSCCNLIRYELYSMIGNKIKFDSFEDGKAIDISDLSKGQYLLKIYTEEGNVVKRILKK